MKNYSRIAIIAVLVILWGCAAPRTEIKIMSFNIRYGSADDGGNSWRFRKELLVNLLEAENADLIGMQEALHFQISELLERFPEYKMVGVGRDDGRQKGEYSCILYKTEKFELLDSGTFWFSDTPGIPNSTSWGNQIPRICTWAKFKSHSGGKVFYHYNLHLDHQSQNSREKSVELLLQRVERTDSDLPVIITGDFNAGESNPAIIKMKSRFVDSYRILNPSEKSVGTYHQFLGIDTGDKIDYVFIDNKVKVSDAKIIKNEYGERYPSDHFPVSAEIYFK